MTTMLERVAEAQYAVLQEQAGGRLPVWAKLDDHARSLMLKQVRAGLEVLRDPSPGFPIAMAIDTIDAILAEVPA